MCMTGRCAVSDNAGERGRDRSGDNPVDGVDKSVNGRAERRVRPRTEDPAVTRSDGQATHCPHEGADRLGQTGDQPGERPVGEAPQAAPEQLRGPDLARSALQAARDSARSRGRAAATARRRAGGGGSGVRRRGWSGARPDDRDPQPLGRLAARLVSDRGWTDRVSAGLVFGRWAQLVGADVAEHATPVSLREGELTVQAGSTAWATQLRLLQRQVLGRISAGVGPDVVTTLRVQGPSKPSWQHGPRHVRGRGPRDTYG